MRVPRSIIGASSQRVSALSISLRHSPSSCSTACSLRTSSRPSIAADGLTAGDICGSGGSSTSSLVGTTRSLGATRGTGALCSGGSGRSGTSSCVSERSRPIRRPRNPGLRSDKLSTPFSSSEFSSRAPCGGCGAPSLPHRLDEFRPLLAQDALHAADGVALAVEQMADAAQQIDIVGTVIAPPAAALHRLDFAETASPRTAARAAADRDRRRLR